MSAVAIILRASEACVLTDGAGIDESVGHLRWIGSKVYLLPKINAAASFMGPKDIGPALADMLSIGENYDDAEARVGDVLRERLEPERATIERMTGMPMEFALYVAGISEKRGPHSYMIQSIDHPLFAQIKAWTPFDAGPVWLSPGTDELLATVDPARFDPVMDGIRIMEAQRQIAQPQGPQGEMRCIVGGFVQLTTIAGDAITTRIIHRWPDKIGERISPAPG